MPNILAIAGPDSKYKQPGATPAGFLGGLWHGLISPLTFLVSLFNPDVRIYETANNGWRMTSDSSWACPERSGAVDRRYEATTSGGNT
jgi:hypothetical protein